MTQTMIEMELASISQKLDLLQTQIASLDEQVVTVTTQVETIQRRQRAEDELQDDFWHDVLPLTGEMLGELSGRLAEMEHKGYFAFARETQNILDQVVGSFGEDDLRQLGENIVLILNTLKSMTQPEIMTLLNNLTTSLREVESHPETLSTSYLGLVRQLRDPEVRRGLAATMTMLKLVGHGSPLEAEANHS